jgi:glycosyltransferase involved in cell wall biosynthesis
MNIAHILPYSAKFPLSKHNGRYEWAIRLATMQAERGHKVCIYCAPDSNLVISGIDWKSLPNSFGDKTTNNLALIRYALGNEKHDIYHSNLDYLHYVEADRTKKPIIFTQHWFPNEQIASAVALNHNKNVTAVPVTHYMHREDIRLGIPCSNVIYNGVDLHVFVPNYEPRADRLLYVGRITQQKGVREIVAITRKAGVKIDLVGKINSSDSDYWATILPFVDGDQVRYLGPKNRQEVAQLYAKAKALLFLPQQLEAFGQTIIEAQACGLPVITNDSGASSELVTDCKTGFITRNEQECIEAFKQIGSIDPHACRTFAERFDQQQMFNSYELLYRRLTLPV